MKRRCFIAINLPKNVKWEIEALISELAALNQKSQINFTKTENLHITIQFLGELEERQIIEVKNILDQIAKEFRSTEILIGAIAAFPNQKNPNIIYLEITESQDRMLTKLHKRIEDRLGQLLKNDEQKNWTAHLTICRIKNQEKFKTDGIKTYDLSAPIHSFDLMESSLGGNGAEYETISSFNLKK